MPRSEWIDSLLVYKDPLRQLEGVWDKLPHCENLKFKRDVIQSQYILGITGCVPNIDNGSPLIVVMDRLGVRMRDLSTILTLGPDADFTLSYDKTTNTILRRLTFVEAIMLFDMMCIFMMARFPDVPLTCTPIYFIPQLEVTRIVVGHQHDDCFVVLDHDALRSLPYIAPGETKMV